MTSSAVFGRFSEWSCAVLGGEVGFGDHQVGAVAFYHDLDARLFVANGNNKMLPRCNCAFVL